MVTFVPIGMCLFFTAVVGFLVFTDPSPADAGPEHLQEHGQFRPGRGALLYPLRDIMTAGKIVDKLIKFAHVLVSWLPGGLGMAGCLACGMFGAISGSTVPPWWPWAGS